MPSPASHNAPASGPTRRELNKAATRQAITDAALGLLRTRGPGNFTVEDIADAAGISRRTFFNYFASTEAALASVTFGFLDTALRQFRLRPAGEPILESARAALVELADPMTVAPVAELYSLGQANPQLSRSELEAWDHCTEQIIDAARERFAPAADAGAAGGAGAGAAVGAAAVGVDELYLRALAGAIISCGKAALDVWFARCGGDLGPASLAALRQLLIDSMSLLGSGFAGPAAASAAAGPSAAATSTASTSTVSPSPDRH
jgi:AcrR family transcriptional regulator